MKRICQCGCEQEFIPSGKRGSTLRFLPGHQFLTPKAQATKQANNLQRRIAPPQEVLARDGLCECGCGQHTKIAPCTNQKLGMHKGYPMRYIKGHNAVQSGGTQHHLFKGRQIQNGYVLIYRPDHPAAYKTPKSRRGYVLEHRIIVETKMERFLTLNEQVHHINGIRDDNRPENLIVLTRSQHRALHRSSDNITKETRRRLSESTKRAHAEGRINKR